MSKFETDYDGLSDELLCFNVDPKLFAGKHKNDIEGKHSDTIVREDVLPSSSRAGASYSMSATMKKMIIKQLEAEIKLKNAEIKMITESIMHLNLLLGDLKNPVREVVSKDEEEDEDLPAA